MTASLSKPNTAGGRPNPNDTLRPIIIIGAGRSGTNILRDLLVSQPAFATWPCDEINYIWRHGNRDHPTDQFTRDMADGSTRKFIRKQFSQFSLKHPQAQIIEKTCANSLRCGFVHEIFPAAKFIHIIRDGRDVAASAALRWNAKLDVPYLLKKARFVPWTDLPYYGFKYFQARLYRLYSGQQRLSTWGPKFDSMESVFREHDLEVGCAIQWRQCVQAAIDQLDELPSDQVLTIQYESFAEQPVSELKRIFQFLGHEVDQAELQRIAERVSSKSIGKWRSQLSEQQVVNIEEVAGDLLNQLGYV
ncbi:MAG: sulfotransferase [Planctomycetota bacterium]